MPELPEVETIRRQLKEELSGFTFVGVRTNWEKSFRPSLAAVKKAVAGEKIETVGRLAKLLVFDLFSGSHLLFHLKLTGRLLVRNPSAPSDDYTVSVFSLKKGSVGKELRFADARKFGFVQLITNAGEMARLSRGYGPEPLADLTLEKFREVLGGTKRPVKVVLMDQAKISGIGNIYANEALFLAKIHPQTPADKLTGREAQGLLEAIEAVFKEGLKYGGASDQWYRQIHGEKGSYQEHFLVYGRGGKACGRCGRCGAAIQRIELGGRGTFFCPRCQKG